MNSGIWQLALVTITIIAILCKCFMKGQVNHWLNWLIQKCQIIQEGNTADEWLFWCDLCMKFFGIGKNSQQWQYCTKTNMACQNYCSTPFVFICFDFLLLSVRNLFIAIYTKYFNQICCPVGQVKFSSKKSTSKSKNPFVPDKH